MKTNNPLVSRITLIEIILGLMIILIVVAIYISISEVINEQTTPQKKATQPIKETPQLIKIKHDTLSITNALKFYKLDNNFYPSTVQGIQALTVKPVQPPIPNNWVQYLKEVPLDPWGRPYIYVNNNSSGIKVYVQKRHRESR